ncbi:MAG TPA: response regulator [Terriglobia bacterium]|nr:response regulator [Terriglobia bacterium]
MNANSTIAPPSSLQLLRVLMVENEPADVELCVRELEKAGLSVAHDIVQTREAFLERVRSQHYDVVLADFNLPGWDGIDALACLKQEGLDTPFILVTGTLGEEAAVECIKKGATDYLLKDRLARLPVAVRAAIEERERREEQARAGLALRTSEERYRLLYERNLAGVYSTTLDGHILDLNEACARMFGYPSREEAMRHTLWDIAPNEAEVRMLIAVVQAQKTFTNLEVRLKRIDGRAVWVLGSASLIESPTGEAPFIEGTLLDITERKQLEEQLRQSQKIEAVGRLAGGVAHDFNNLLTAILGYSDLALETLPDSSPLRRQILEIKKAGERAASLTRQLLAFSRQQVLAPQVLDLNTVVAEMEKLLRRLIGEDIELTSVSEPRLGRVKADPGQIEQVILNLAVNARDAMPEGGQITLETANFVVDEAHAREHLGLNPGPYVALAVRDTGCGMDAEIRSHIFEPFFTTKEKGKGTGLGLSMVYGVVKQSGGYIWVESEPGQGSCFTVYLPRVEAELPGKKNPSVVGRTVASETILLVEDEDSVRELVRRVLEAKGYKVLEASRGEQALEAAEKHPDPIRLLLTDVVMPHMNGRELARRLAPSHPEARVLFMSGYIGNTADGKELESEGAFLHKPFTSDALARKVREVLQA